MDYKLLFLPGMIFGFVFVQAIANRTLEGGTTEATGQEEMSC